jgi:hypothetical protein
MEPPSKVVVLVSLDEEEILGTVPVHDDEGITGEFDTSNAVIAPYVVEAIEQGIAILIVDVAETEAVVPDWQFVAVATCVIALIL